MTIYLLIGAAISLACAGINSVYVESVFKRDGLLQWEFDTRMRYWRNGFYLLTLVLAVATDWHSSRPTAPMYIFMQACLATIGSLFLIYGLTQYKKVVDDRSLPNKSAMHVQEQLWFAAIFFWIGLGIQIAIWIMLID